MDLILIDGRSGSGKSDFATALMEFLPGTQLLRLDDVYPGWDGLAAVVAEVPRILETGRWREWDWSQNRAGDWHTLDVAAPLVIEGVGALSRASRPYAHTALWFEADDETRKRRALERDGETYAPHWDRWASQELEFITQENPRALADAIVKT